MISIDSCPVTIQTSAQSVPSTPGWMGEVARIAHSLRQQGVLSAITEQVRFARRRFGRYEVLDFVAVLRGSAISGARTLEAFDERLSPWAEAFMAMFGRERLPARSTLSRFVAARSPEPVEALRTLFLKDLLARPLDKEEHMAGVGDRQGTRWIVFDVDGTREAARHRALPQTADRPVPHRRLRPLCAPGYTGRKRGEVVPTRTTVLQAHTHQWLASFGNPGNAQYREELRRAVAAIQSYVQAGGFPEQDALLRLDGQYGTGAVLSDLAGLSYVTRGKDYRLLERAEVQSRLHLPADQHLTHRESGICRALYDCPEQLLGKAGQRVRIIVATHPAGAAQSRVGLTRCGVVSERFLTNLPQSAFTAADVVTLYLHRGAFETALADEDVEQDPDRGCRHAAWGQEAWHIISHWVWNLPLELGQQLHPAPVRTTEFAPELEEQASSPSPAQGYGPIAEALPWKAGRFSGRDCVLQPDGTLLCPAGQSLRAHERRREADGSLRVVYAASMRSCRPCPLREQCPWQGSATAKPRQVSLLLHPRAVGSVPLRWRDWSRRLQRRACMQLRCQRLEVQMESGSSARPTLSPAPRSCAQRAHDRLGWQERFARNARAPTASRVTIKLFGVPEDFATSRGLATA